MGSLHLFRSSLTSATRAWSPRLSSKMTYVLYNALSSTSRGTRSPQLRLNASFLSMVPFNAPFHRQSWVRQHSTSSSTIDKGFGVDKQQQPVVVSKASSEGGEIEFSSRSNSFQRKKKGWYLKKKMLGDLDSEPLLSNEGGAQGTISGADTYIYRAQGEGREGEGLTTLSKLLLRLRS